MFRKGFIQISLLAAIIIAAIGIMSAGAGVVLYKQQKALSFTAGVSDIIYKTFYEKDAEIERLKQELELSKIKAEIAQNLVQEETAKRTGAEAAQKEAEQKAKEEAVKRAQEEAARITAEEKAEQEEEARQLAEQKAQEEEAARKAAEAKAKQEEFERKLKEQQLADKEAEEKMMNTDNDGDGLTYREELAKGTSDWNTDSDADGIIDGQDSHPAGGGRNISQTFSWRYGGYNWTWTESIHEDWYDYYKAKPRVSNPNVEYITSDDPFIKKVSKEISESVKTGISKTGLAVSFVQNLSYVEDVYTGYDEYPKYPIETFFEKNGDCEDTSYLAASILNAMNIDSVLIVLPGHMAVGVRMDCNTAGTYYELNGKCYYFVETTGKNWAIGRIPTTYFNNTATLIKIPSGETITNVSPH